MSKNWISVNDSLPNKGEEVIGLYAFGEGRLEAVLGHFSLLTQHLRTDRLDIYRKFGGCPTVCEKVEGYEHFEIQYWMRVPDFSNLKVSDD